MTEFREKLEPLCNEFNISLSDEAFSNLEKYYNLIVIGNSKMNLTGSTELDVFLEKHILDCLILKNYIKDGYSLVDVGTGAGMPGLILACACPNANFVLVESMRKRCNFLEETVGELGLNNVKIACNRAEEVGQIPEFREKFDIATARAVKNMQILSEYLLPLVKVGGSVLAMKGKIYQEECEAAKNAVKQCGGAFGEHFVYKLPGEENRAIVRVDKKQHCPKKYPRKVGMVEKSPL